MKIKIKVALILFCTLCTLGSCVTNKQTELMQEIAKDYPTIAKPEEYKVIPGDMLTIQVYTMDEYAETLFKNYIPSFISQRVDDRTHGDAQYIRGQDGTWNATPIPVYADGTINFPHIGRVYVEGFTMLEVRNVLSEKLGEIAEGTSAEVSLFNRYFSVLGELGAQRIIMTNNQITIFQALATSGTISSSGDRSKVTILRQTKDGSTIKTFDLRSKDIVDSDFYYVQANDVLYVPQSKRKFLGAPTSFINLFGLLTSIAGIVIFAIRII